MKQQQQMLNIQKSLREIHAELDRTARGEDRYLQLITKVITTKETLRTALSNSLRLIFGHGLTTKFPPQEHSLLKEDRALLAEFRATEKQEYDHFSLLSFALRESHEKERAQAEKTKYWSIIGSITGTIIGRLDDLWWNQKIHPAHPGAHPSSNAPAFHFQGRWRQH